jgi:anti-sigma B factor antagonist
MPDGSFPVEVVRGVPVVATPEEIDISNAEALRSALIRTAPNGHGALVVDMTRTRFCDSSGLHTLIAAHKRAQAEGRELLLVIPRTTVLRVFALTGMDHVIPNFTSLAEALAQAAATANGHGRPRNDGDAAPRTSQASMAPDGQLPSTLKRSSKEAQQTFTRALASAVQAHGEGDEAFRAAYVEFKRTFEKCGDRWIPKRPLPIGPAPAAEGSGAALVLSVLEPGELPPRHDGRLSGQHPGGCQGLLH